MRELISLSKEGEIAIITNGAPMRYADTVGLKQVHDRVSEFHARHGDLWEPALLLRKLAEQGRAFADFDKGKAAAA